MRTHADLSQLQALEDLNKPATKRTEIEWIYGY